MPTIGGGSADPIGTVAPPVGWEPEGGDDVDALTIVVCRPGDACYSEPSPDDLDEEDDRLKNQIEDELGAEDEDTIYVHIPNVSKDAALEFVNNSLKFFEVNNGGGITEAERVAVLQNIALSAAAGEITPELVADVNETLNAAFANDVEGVPLIALAAAPAISAPFPNEGPRVPGRVILRGLRAARVGTVFCIFLCGMAGDPDEGRIVRSLDYLDGVLLTEVGEDNGSSGGNLPEGIDVEDVIESSRRPSGEGSETTRGVAALQKKLDRKNEPYSGLEKNQETAEDVIRGILETEKPTVQVGSDVVNVHDPVTGRGVRIRNGQFEGFLNPPHPK